jgi:hypothetical protein
MAARAVSAPGYTMKPRPNWTIAEGGASARRTDGVTAGFMFLGEDKPYGARRGAEDLTAGSRVPRKFSTLDKAMEAADKIWPVQCKTN